MVDTVGLDCASLTRHGLRLVTIALSAELFANGIDPLSRVTKKKRLRLLCTVRDIGAGGHVLEIVDAVRRAGHTADIIAQEPMSKMVRERFARYQNASSIIDERVPRSMQSVAAVKRLVREKRYDAVICGQSGYHESGIDECVVTACSQLGLRCFVMQDFWGDVRRADDALPSDYLVLDDFAARVTRQKCQADIHAVGSIKHSNFLNTDYHFERSKLRATIGLSSTAHVIGVFGQRLNMLDGYAQVVEDMSRAAKSVNARILYKPHPAEDESCTNTALDSLSVAGSPLLVGSETPLKTVLCAVDIAASCFSTVGLDAAYLRRALGTGPAVVYANYPDQISDFWRRSSLLDRLPMVEAGYAFEARDQSSLIREFERALSKEGRGAQLRNVYASLDDPTDAPNRVVRLLENLLAPRESNEVQGEGHVE